MIFIIYNVDIFKYCMPFTVPKAVKHSCAAPAQNNQSNQLYEQKLAKLTISRNTTLAQSNFEKHRILLQNFSFYLSFISIDTVYSIAPVCNVISFSFLLLRSIVSGHRSIFVSTNAYQYDCDIFEHKINAPSQHLFYESIGSNNWLLELKIEKYYIASHRNGDSFE